MKILQFGKAYPPVNLGGVESTIQLITEGLHEANVTCDVLGVNDNRLYTLEDVKMGKIHRASLLKKAFSTLFSFNLISILSKIHKEYDIIHIHHPDPMCAFALWLIKPKCKIVVHWHSDILKQKLLLKIYRPFQSWLLRRADIIIATSPTYAKFSGDLKLYQNKIEIVPIGIDMRQLESDGPIVENIRSKYKDKKILLSIGRMTYYKGYDSLIDSISYLSDEYVLLIIGDGELKNDLEMKVEQLGLDKKVVFLGKVNDLERNSYLKACDLFVLSSIFKTEAFAIVQVEAMAFSKPIVSTIIPGSGVDWVNQNMLSGLTVPINNPHAIARAIQEIMENENLYLELATGAHRRFLDEFTQEIMINRLIKIYNKLLK